MLKGLYMCKKIIFSLMLLPCFWGNAAFAITAPEGATTDVIVTGEIQEDPACEINGGNEKTVPFGKINATKIDSGEYLQSFNLDVDCDAAAVAAGQAFTFTWDGTLADFDGGSGKIIKVNDVNNLGVKLIKDGSELTLGQSENFDPASGVIKLDALLVKKKDADVSAGDFYATAIIQLNIQ